MEHVEARSLNIFKKVITHVSGTKGYWLGCKQGNEVPDPKIITCPFTTQLLPDPFSCSNSLFLTEMDDQSEWQCHQVTKNGGAGLHV